MSPITPTASGSLNAPTTGEFWLALMTMEHSSFTSPIRLVANNEDVTSNGNVYTAAGLNTTLPDETPDGLPEVDVTFEDIDQTIVQQLRDIPAHTTDRPTMTLSVVLRSDPDSVQLGPWELEMLTFQLSRDSIQARVGIINVGREPFPGLTFEPASFPGIF